MALSDIPLLRSKSVAFGAKRTFNQLRLPNRTNEYPALVRCRPPYLASLIVCVAELRQVGGDPGPYTS